jgi:hypothetical protein
MLAEFDANRLRKQNVRMKLQLVIGTVILSCALVHARAEEPLFIAPLYVEYVTSSAEEFANEAKELKQRIGEGPGVRVGFSTFLNMKLTRVDLNKPVDSTVMQPTLAELDLILDRARSSQLPVHISIISGFFHGNNLLRETAIRDDVRNAQWFSDGSISSPEEATRRGQIPRSAWITPSRYAKPLRQRIQESILILGKKLAAAMEQNPATLLNVSGDSEVELSFARYLNAEGRPRAGGLVLLADYSPFMVAEFRDWLRKSRYTGDASPATDDDNDGHTFNKDFQQQFRTWKLRYFDESGPIPYDQYRALQEKLPQSGPYFIDGGFDAPRAAAFNPNPFWKAWEDFRVTAIKNYVRDFGEWITTDSRVPSARFYTHQIPADYLFGGKDTGRLATSASPLETALIPGTASSGVTVFDIYNGKTHSKTSSAALFKRLQQASANWGILEYSPSVPMMKIITLASCEPSIHTIRRSSYPSRGRMMINTSSIKSKTPLMNTLFENLFKRSGNDIHRQPIV